MLHSIATAINAAVLQNAPSHIVFKIELTALKLSLDDPYIRISKLCSFIAGDNLSIEVPR